MKKTVIAAIGIVALWACSAAAAEPTPVGDLAVPPASAEHFTIMSTAGKHGESTRWTTPQGIRMARESILLRGQATEVDSASHLGFDKMLDRVTVRGFTPNGDAAETFFVAARQATWKSPVDGTSGPYKSPAMYAAFGGPIDLFADLVEALIATPEHSLALLPAGQAHAEVLSTRDVSSGADKKTVTLYAITGLFNTPVTVWVDGAGKFFASIGSLSWVSAGYESEEKALVKEQDAALAKRSPALVKALLKTPTGAVAFTHVRAFLDGTHFAPEQTVIVEKGVITQVGAQSLVKIPAGAQIIEGAGRTLVPGLWDSHMHLSDDASATLLLALGITSARDPGNDNTLTLARAARRAKGELLSPRIYPSLLIDGKGPNTAQVASVAASETEALDIVRKARADGFIGIKLYGSLNPNWVKPIATEAHRLGLHVHGHLPAGLRPSEAIDDGYDEITHINFVMMQAMPDSVVNKSNGIMRFEGVGRFAKDVKLDAEPMQSLIAKMAQHKTTVDPTLVVYEGLFVPENGDLSAAYAPFVGTLPPAVERGFRQGGFSVPADLQRADFRASFAKLQELVGALHRAGVPIVAGTDGSGLELIRELELYVDAGFTPSQALASATLATAHLVGADGYTGSIAVGKNADLVLVEGDPSKVIGDLRHVRTVMMDGKLMDAGALRAAGGISGRPRAAD